MLESTTEVTDAPETRTTEISTTESVTTDESTTEGMMYNLSIILYIKNVIYFAFKNNFL